MTVLLVTAGGAIGSVARWWVGTLLVERGPRFGPTLVVNGAGAALLGVVVGLGWRGGWFDFIGMGLIGGFTTMSSFAADIEDLARRRSLYVASALGLTAVVGVGVAATARTLVG
ncbi:MAG TPA: CrcB family protein [Acidimicrobiales bacterium]